MGRETRRRLEGRKAEIIISAWGSSPLRTQKRSCGGLARQRRQVRSDIVHNFVLHLGGALVLFWSGPPLALHWYYPGALLVLHWHSTGTPLVLHWHITATVLALY